MFARVRRCVYHTGHGGRRATCCGQFPPSTCVGSRGGAQGTKSGLKQLCKVSHLTGPKARIKKNKTRQDRNFTAENTLRFLDESLRN